MSKSSPMSKRRSRIRYMASSLGPAASWGSTRARPVAVWPLGFVAVPHRWDRRGAVVAGLARQAMAAPRPCGEVGHPSGLLVGAGRFRDAASGAEQGPGEPRAAGAQLLGGDVEVGLPNAHRILLGPGERCRHDGSPD